MAGSRKNAAAEQVPRTPLWEAWPWVLLARLLVLAFVLLILLRMSGWLEGLELAAYDQFLKWRAGEDTTQSPRVTIVAIDDRALEDWSWPVPDGRLAQIIAKLLEGGALAVGLDIYRDRPIPPGSEALNRLFAAEDRLVGIMKFALPGEAGIAPPSAITSPTRIGFSDSLVDRDGRVRRGLLYLSDGEKVATSLALQLALKRLAPEGIRPAPLAGDTAGFRLGAVKLVSLPGSFGGYHAADSGGLQFAFDYRLSPQAIDWVLARDLLAGRVPSERLRDRVVVLGIASGAVKDPFILPLTGRAEGGAAYGIELHALALDQLLRMALGLSAPTRAPTAGFEWLVILGLGLASLLPGLLLRGAGALLALAAIGMGGTLLGSYIAFLYGWWLPLVPMVFALLATSLSLISARVTWERRQRAVISQLLAIQGSPELARQLWRQRGLFLSGLKPRPLRLTATILFADLVGSTALSDDLSPEALMTTVSDYLAAMAEAATRYGGFIEKFTGDGVMVVFGAPVPRETTAEIARDARNAANCALAMEDALVKLNQDLKDGAALRMRVGIATGPVSAGTVGSRARNQYTVIGRAANLAARLESLEKENPAFNHDEAGEVLICRILLSKGTAQHLAPGQALHPLGPLPVPGIEERAEVFRLTGQAQAPEPSAEEGERT